MREERRGERVSVPEIPWIEDLPAHWKTIRARHLFRVTNHPVREGDEVVTCFRDGEVTLRRNRREGGFMVALLETGYQGVRPGQLVVHSMDAFAGAVGVSDSQGKCSPEYIVCDMREGLANAEFYARTLRWMAKQDYIQAVCSAVRERAPRIRFDTLGDMALPCPPLDEQNSIVRFLGEKERDIEFYLETKRKMIAVLEERLAVLINDLVAPEKVPADWRRERFKRHVGYQEGPGIMAADFRDAGVPLLRLACLASDEATLNGCNYLDPTMAAHRWSHFRVCSGDYLLSCSASTGSVSIASEEVVGAIPYTGILRLWKRSGEVEMEFVRWFIRGRDFRSQIAAHQSGVGLQHFGPTHLGRFTMLVPPLEVQRLIAQRLQRHSAETHNAVTTINQEIAAMEQYRTRLIADAVTGQIDVRGLG